MTATAVCGHKIYPSFASWHILIVSSISVSSKLIVSALKNTLPLHTTNTKGQVIWIKICTACENDPSNQGKKNPQKILGLVQLSKQKWKHCQQFLT